MITYLSVGLPTDVVALIIFDGAWMLILAQDGARYEIVEAILERLGSPDHPGLIVITQRR